MFERFTEEARQAVARAEEEVRHLRHGQLGPAHLLLGIARVQPGLLGRPVDELRERLAAREGTRQGEPAPPGTPSPLAPTAQAALVAAAQGPSPVAPPELLLALVEVAPAALRRLDLDPAAARAAAAGVPHVRGGSLPEQRARLGLHDWGGLSPF